jgi:hypothetical protein
MAERKKLTFSIHKQNFLKSFHSPHRLPPSNCRYRQVPTTLQLLCHFLQQRRPPPYVCGYGYKKCSLVHRQPVPSQEGSSACEKAEITPSLAYLIRNKNIRPLHLRVINSAVTTKQRRNGGLSLGMLKRGFPNFSPLRNRPNGHGVDDKKP